MGLAAVANKRYRDAGRNAADTAAGPFAVEQGTQK